MDHVAIIEKYRKQACVMRRRGIPVTKARLARLLRVSRGTVCNTVNRKDWRRQYIGVTSQADVTLRAYRAAALALKGNAIVTKSQIARKLRVTLRAVQSYLDEHPEVFAGLAVTVVDHHVHAFAIRRYRAAAARVKATGKPLTRKMLAFELKVGRAAVGNYLAAHPELVVELGIIDTRDL